jgi:hypothetical protein
LQLIIIILKSGNGHRTFIVVSENGKWSKGPSMVEKRGFFTLNNVGDTLGKKKQSTKV